VKTHERGQHTIAPGESAPRSWTDRIQPADRLQQGLPVLSTEEEELSLGGRTSERRRPAAFVGQLLFKQFQTIQYHLPTSSNDLGPPTRKHAKLSTSYLVRLRVVPGPKSIYCRYVYNELPTQFSKVPTVRFIVAISVFLPFPMTFSPGCHFEFGTPKSLSARSTDAGHAFSHGMLVSRHQFRAALAVLIMCRPDGHGNEFMLRAQVPSEQKTSE